MSGKPNVDSEMGLLKKKKPGLSERTYLTYRTSLIRLKKVSPNYEVASINAYLSGLKNSPLGRNLLTPLLILYPQRFRSLFDELQRASEKVLTNQRPSRSQAQNVTTLKEVRRMLRRMREDINTHKLHNRKFNSMNTVERRLLIAYTSFSLLLDITMRNDSNTLQMARTTSDTNEQGNWYVHSTGTVVLRKFKTARSFTRRGGLPLYLGVRVGTKRVLDRYIKTRQLDARWLFSLRPGKQLTKTQHATILTSHSFRYLGVRLGTTMLRHLVLSEFERTNPTLKERKEKMRRMQQLTIETQMSYAWRDEGVEENI